ncbi:hypothetical protein KR49_00170 [Synechococcus sp. KORDI-49]|nr:hypothetical protein KR49_00170 [Synechococcus sp. KORDI-49]
MVILLLNDLSLVSPILMSLRRYQCSQRLLWMRMFPLVQSWVLFALPIQKILLVFP